MDPNIDVGELLVEQDEEVCGRMDSHVGFGLNSVIRVSGVLGNVIFELNFVYI